MTHYIHRAYIAGVPSISWLTARQRRTLQVTSIFVPRPPVAVNSSSHDTAATSEFSLNKGNIVRTKFRKLKNDNATNTDKP